MIWVCILKFKWCYWSQGHHRYLLAYFRIFFCARHTLHMRIPSIYLLRVTHVSPLSSVGILFYIQECVECEPNVFYSLLPAVYKQVSSRCACSKAHYAPQPIALLIINSYGVTIYLIASFPGQFKQLRNQPGNETTSHSTWPILYKKIFVVAVPVFRHVLYDCASLPLYTSRNSMVGHSICGIEVPYSGYMNEFTISLHSFPKCW